MDSKSGVTPNQSLSIRTSRKSPGREQREKRVDDDGDREITEEPLSPAGRLFHQPRFNCYIITIMSSGKPIDLDVVKAGVQATIVRHPRFSSIAIDESNHKKLKWIRTKVNVDNHLIVPDLDPTTSSSIPDQLVEDYVASLSLTSMDYSRPLWEFHLLNFPTSETAAVSVLRVHHSLGDGVSLISMLLVCTRKTVDSSSLPSLPKPHQSNHFHDNSRLASGRILQIILWIFSIVTLVWHTLIDIVLFLATTLFLEDTSTPFKGKEGVELHPKRFVHRNVNLDDIKHVKNATNCTINDVLVGVILAGLSRYLHRKYDSDGKRKSHGETSG